MNSNVFIVAAERVAEAWEKEATLRKQRTPSDPAADAIASCASELRERMAAVDRESAYLTVADFAKQRGIHESTVRRLCRQREIEGAEQDIDGNWRIPRDASRRQRTA